MLIAKVGEMEGSTQLPAFYRYDNLLQIFACLTTSDADLLALDLRLYFQLAVFNEFNEFLGQVGFYPML
ncbi:hypothetical protein BG74_08585 [Sodalis-like endosymbiont of Proechinophthirus fluctus]|nr:hypothetical protein BG74_08585 [Sodalis-like endosymbiont of Proechinophthirus fluctus]